jgi:putative drug exporter of the RND superfamily
MRRVGLQSIAGACARHPWRTLTVWAVVLVCAAAITVMYLGGALRNEQSFTNDPESARATALINQTFPGNEHTRELVIVRSAGLTVDDQQFRDRVQTVTSRVMQLGPGVVLGGIDYTTDPSPVLVSADRHAALLVFTMAKPVGEAVDDAEALAAAAREAAASTGATTGAAATPGSAAATTAATTAAPAVAGSPSFEVLVTGEASINKDFATTAERDLRTGEIFGVGIALVILVVVFGAVVTAAIPLVMALAAILLAMGITALLGQVMDLSFFITNMITMIGLAMGTDYSLFVVSRYREERAAGREKVEAICLAGSTATRAVVFSAAAVILALSGLFLVPSTLFHSMALGAIVAVFTALLAALTLLPALLGALGDRVNALRVPFLHKAGGTAGRTGGFWDRLTNGVMRRPVVSLVVAGAALALLAGLYFSINLGSAGVDTLPTGMASRQGFQVLESDFPGASIQPVEITIAGDAASPAVVKGVNDLRDILAGDGAFMGAGTTRVSPNGELTVLSLVVLGEPNGKAAQAAVRTLRADYVPAAFSGTGLVAGTDVLTTGQTSLVVDYLDTINGATGWVFLFVLGLSFVLLLVVFRSVIVPLKAILMNLLSVGAAYGLMVAVFQKGWGADLLGLQRVDFVEAWVPLFLFAVLFGTSMDYHVFLLSRIRERFDQTGDNRESVAFGLRRTGGIITGAALIMVAVFGGFAAGDLVMFQQLGFGLAVAVFLDATVVRCVLVPAAMRLLGTANWWFPRWLRWLPDLRVEGGVPVAVGGTAERATGGVTPHGGEDARVGKGAPRPASNPVWAPAPETD